MDADSGRDRKDRSLLRVVVRVVLVALAFVLLWRGEHAFSSWGLQYARTFQFPLAWWALSLALVMLSGFAFGLAVSLPDRPRFHSGRTMLLGAIPFVLIVHASLIRATTARSLGMLNREFFFDQPSVFFPMAVLLGVAIAAGFTHSGDA